MKSLKKIITTLIILNVALLSMWALPGFESFIPDSSGEYVYYEDTTFLRKSYIGLLYFDNSTIQVRYYAPADTEKKLPENEISILITVDPEAPHWKMTGERILSTITPNTDDVELVNYLHDMLYEFSSHRILVEDLNARDIEIYQDFPQFGGDVVICYDCTIPMFNIRDIENDNGDKLLKCVTVGQLTSNSDPSFDNFKGIPDTDVKKTWKRYKKSSTVTTSFENQSVDLDKNWTQKMDNLWAMNNDDSMLSLNTTTIPPLNDPTKVENFLIRYFTKGNQNSYLVYETLEIKEDDDKLLIQAETYNPTSKKSVVNNIIIAKNKDPKYIDFFTLATYKQPWVTNKKYYEKIIDSYEN